MKRSAYINIIFACVCFVQSCTANNNDSQQGMISVSDFKKLFGEELAKLDKIYKAELKIRDEKYQQGIENLRNEMLTYRKNFQRQILKYKKTIENQQQEMGVRIREMESQNSIFPK